MLAYHVTLLTCIRKVFGSNLGREPDIETEIFVIFFDSSRQIRGGKLSRYSDRLRAGRPWVRLRTGARDFSLLHNFQTSSGAHPASYPMGSGGAFSQEVKRQGRDAYHSLPSSAEMENRTAITPLPHTSSWCDTYLTYHKENLLYFTLLYFTSNYVPTASFHSLSYSLLINKPSSVRYVV
jgi:hypothetical protein